MRIDVEPRFLDLAEVTFTPAWWRRLFLRESTETRFAARTTTGRWIWDDTSRPILDPRIEHELDRARIDAVRLGRDLRPPS